MIAIAARAVMQQMIIVHDARAPTPAADADSRRRQLTPTAAAAAAGDVLSRAVQHFPGAQTAPNLACTDRTKSERKQ